MAAEPTLETYFQEAASWDADRFAEARRSARLAWRVAAAGWVCALAGALAVLGLAPLKSVEPFVIRVDRSTGVVDVVPVYTGHAPLSPTITRYFLTRYVSVCERFDLATAESDYQQCGAFHSARENQRWYAQWNPSNPTSPLNVHKDGSVVRVQVESVSFLPQAGGAFRLAQVRYLTLESPATTATPAHVTHWIATIAYRYTHPPSDPKLRLWNPLGFEVERFDAQPEVLPGSPAAAAGSAATSSSDQAAP